MLSGRYPSDDFADLRPRLTWDRAGGHAHGARGRQARRGHQRRNDSRPRALRRVSHRRARPGAARVGELDEEMVFESRVGETFLLGASAGASRRSRTTACSCLPRRASPARCRSGRQTRPAVRWSSAAHIGEMVRALRQMPPAAAVRRLTEHHDLDQQAAENLMRYLADQAAAAGVVPDDRTIVVERCRDELGDWRICVLTPFGGRIHAPWAMAVVERVRAETGIDVETHVDRRWVRGAISRRRTRRRTRADDAAVRTRPRRSSLRQLGRHRAVRGQVPRERPRARCCCPSAGRAGAARCGSSASAPRICWPWPSQFGSFPMLLEAYRECLRDVFDMPALVDTLRRIERARDQAGDRRFDHAVAVRVGAALRLRRQLHLRRRRAAGRAPRAGALDRSGAAARAARRGRAAGAARRRRARGRRAPAAAARRDTQRAKTVDGVHDLLLRLGDLTLDEIAARTPDRRAPRRSPRWCARDARLPVNIAGERALHRRSSTRRGIATRSACRCRRAAGVAARADCRSRRRISRGATRARTGRSPRSSSPRDTALGRADGGSAAAGARRGGPAARG